jgi:hypothetical protein
MVLLCQIKQQYNKKNGLKELNKNVTVYKSAKSFGDRNVTNQITRRRKILRVFLFEIRWLESL